MPESIAYLEEHRDKVRPGEPIDIGMITEYLYVGDADWELPPYTADRLARTTSPRS